MFSFLLTIPLNSRAMREIERTLKRASSTPPTRYNKEKIKNHLVEVQRLVDALNTLHLPPEEIASAVEPGFSIDGPHGATIGANVDPAPKEGVSFCRI